MLRHLKVIGILVFLIAVLCGTSSALAAEEQDWGTLLPDQQVTCLGFEETEQRPNTRATVYYNTDEEVASVVRNGMVARQEEIFVGYKTKMVPDEMLYDHVRMIFKLVKTHTGVDSQGDYLEREWRSLSYGGNYSYQNGYYYYVLGFWFTYRTTAAQEAELTAAIEDFVAENIEADMTDYQKFCVSYDWICENVTYDHVHLGDESYYMMYTAYAAMFDRTCVCAGYASLLYRMLLQSGVDNRIITGDTSAGYHAWNLVRIGDLYYNTDSTWDAGCSVENYSYCLTSETDFEDHYRDPEFDTPEFHAQYPTSTQSYLREDLYMDEAAAVAELRERLKRRENGIALYVTMPNKPTQAWADELLAQAVAHTGVPDEGDFLKYHIYSYVPQFNYEMQNGNYFVIVGMDMVYYSTREQEMYMTPAIESLLAEIIHPGMTDYEKFDAIYAWMSQNIAYGYSGSGGSNGAAYTALLLRGAAPRGFATLLYRLLLACDVDCRVIKGTVNSGAMHFWNIVQLDGLYYNVDPGWEASNVQQGGNYRYRLQCDKTFTNHNRNSECATTAFYSAHPMGQTDYVPMEKFDIALSRMILGNALEFQFGIPQSAMKDWTGTYATIEKLCPDGTVVTKTIQSKYWGTVQVSGAPYWAISYNGLAAKEMADRFYVTIYDGSGKAVSNVRSDSVRDYVGRAFSGQSAEGKTMMVDMLNYGAAAQQYCNYNTEDLANNSLTAAQLACGTAVSPTTANRLIYDGNYTGTRLILESRIQMQLGFRNLDKSMYAVYTYVDHYGVRYTVRVDGSQFIKLNSYLYAIELSRLVYADARELVSVRVYKADGTLYARASDSMESYIHRAGASGLYEALMKFTDSAKQYLH